MFFNLVDAVFALLTEFVAIASVAVSLLSDGRHLNTIFEPALPYMERYRPVCRVTFSCGRDDLCQPGIWGGIPRYSIHVCYSARITFMITSKPKHIVGGIHIGCALRRLVAVFATEQQES